MSRAGNYTISNLAKVNLMTDPSKSGNPTEVIGAQQSGLEVVTATTVVETAIAEDEATKDEEDDEEDS